jgi:hypothetical protein
VPLLEEVLCILIKPRIFNPLARVKKRRSLEKESLR